MINEITEKNRKALDEIVLAQEIVETLIKNPNLACFHNPKLSKIGDSRWNQHFIRDKLDEINKIYKGYFSQSNPDIPEKVKTFVKDANHYFYGRGK